MDMHRPALVYIYIYIVPDTEGYFGTIWDTGTPTVGYLWGGILKDTLRLFEALTCCDRSKLGDSFWEDSFWEDSFREDSFRDELKKQISRPGAGASSHATKVVFPFY